MSVLDWLLIIFLALAFVSGFHMGFIYKLGSLVGTVLGIIIAGQYYETVAPFVGGGVGGKITAFLLIISLTNTIVGLIFYVVNKVFNIVAIIPGLKFVNRFLGAILGVAQRFLVFSIVLYFANKFADVDAVVQTLEKSKLAPTFIQVGEMLAGLLPQAIQELDSFL